MNASLRDVDLPNGLSPSAFPSASEIALMHHVAIALTNSK
jgi:hypothetical protein